MSSLLLYKYALIQLYYCITTQVLRELRAFIICVSSLLLCKYALILLYYCITTQVFRELRAFTLEEQPELALSVDAKGGGFGFQSVRRVKGHLLQALAKNEQLATQAAERLFQHRCRNKKKNWTKKETNFLVYMCPHTTLLL